MRYKIVIVKISLDFRDKSGNDLISFSRGTISGFTGNTDLPSPTIAMDDLAEQIDAYELVLIDIEAGNTTPENTRLAAQLADKLMLSLTTNGHYVEDTANKAAAGDVPKAEAIILSSGYKLKKKASIPDRDFEIVKTGTSWFHCRVKKTKKGVEIIYWQYGIVPSKGEIPQTKIMHITDKADIIITDLPSGSVVAIANARNETGYQDVKYQHPTFSHQTTVTYDWSEYIYVVIP